MKLYENTLFPHIKHVMQKFADKLPREDLKKFAKEVGKKLVASDFKNKRVEDPTKISEKQEKKVKSYVREYFEKAVAKKREMDKRKNEKAASGSSSSKDKDSVTNGNGVMDEPEADLTKDESDIDMSDDEKSDPLPATPSFSESTDLKRKREESEFGTPGDDADSNKRLKEDESDLPSPPPPPPPPPVDSMPFMEGADDEHLHVEHVKEETEEDREMRKQEEDLMRENEEAMMMDMDGSLKAEESLHNGLPERKGVLSH